jgi:hypothetical protein
MSDSHWQSESDNRGEQLSQEIDKNLSLLNTQESFQIGLPMQPYEQTRAKVSKKYATKGIRVAWQKVPDFGYNVFVCKIGSDVDPGELIGKDQKSSPVSPW